jgi:phage/conjugal plasmid C-4 type zinc finger TraR family protein
MREYESIQGDNLEESDVAQLHSMHIHMNAVAKVRAQLAAQAENPSLEECEKCGDPIPEARRSLIPGVTLCVECKSRRERNIG